MVMGTSSSTPTKADFVSRARRNVHINERKATQSSPSTHDRPAVVTDEVCASLSPACLPICGH